MVIAESMICYASCMMHLNLFNDLLNEESTIATHNGWLDGHGYMHG